MNGWMYAVAVIFLLALNVGSFLMYQDTVADLRQEPMSPRAYLARYCEEPDCNFELMDTIAWCESKWEMVGNTSSSAFGFFQIIQGTEQTTDVWKEGGSRLDPYDNIEMGIELFEKRSFQPWNESRACWHWRYQSALYASNEECLGLGCE